MNDRAIGLLEQYDIEVLRTRKGRGAILCDTKSGCLIFKEYVGNENRILVQDEILKQLKAGGVIHAEEILPTREGTLVVKDGDGVQYILKTYLESRECNIYDRGECAEVVSLLAKLHEEMELPPETEGLAEAFSPASEYDKRNKELKRVRKFLQKRSQKTWFEICLLDTFNQFLEQALRVTEEWSSYESGFHQPDYRYCHGDYQYHNILRNGSGWFLINFEKCLPDSPVRDLYHLLRKLMEKGGWSVSLGRELLAAYEQENPLSAMDRTDLYYRLAYPEKFWKIANFYYNSGKAWIPERNQEKLEKLIEQEKEKQQFLKEVF